MTLGQKKTLRFGTVRLEWKTGFRLRFQCRQYTNFLYFNLYLNTAYGAITFISLFGILGLQSIPSDSELTKV